MASFEPNRTKSQSFIS